LIFFLPLPGKTVCDEILLATAPSPTNWSRLFEPLPIFEGFKHYLMVEVTAANKEDFELWEGWVHSRMRLLIRSAGNMVDVRPWPKAFEPPAPTPDEKTADETEKEIVGPRCFYFIGLAKKRASTYQYGQALVIPQSKVDLTPAVNDFAHKVKDWPDRKPGMELFVRHLLQRSLPEWVKNKNKAIVKTSDSVVDGGEEEKKKRPASEVGEEERPAKKIFSGSTAANDVDVEAVAAVERREDGLLLGKLDQKMAVV
jgi:poly(A) polymerase Pap1